MSFSANGNVGNWFTENWPAMLSAMYPLPVQDRATMRGLDNSDIRLVFLTGRYDSPLPSDSTTGFYIRDDNDTTSLDNDSTIIVGSNGKRWKLMFFPSHSNELLITNFGGVADNVTDNLVPLFAALNSASYWAGIYQAYPKVKFPSAGNHYYFSDCIQAKKMMYLYGDGSGMPGAPQVSLRFAPGKTGVVIHRHNTFGAATVASTTGADGSILEGLQFVGGYSAAPDAMSGSGVWLRARAIIRNCLFSGFSGDGGRCIAVGGGGGATEGVANGWVLENVRFQNNGEWGWQCAGADANAGRAASIDCSGNGTGDVWDNSFLGNKYDMPQSAGSTGGNSGYNTTRGRTGLVYFGVQRWTAKYPATDAQLAATQPGTDSNIWLPGTVTAFGNPTHPLWVAGSPVGTYFSGNTYRFTNASGRCLVDSPYEEGGYSIAYSSSPTQVNNGQLSGAATVLARWVATTSGFTCPGTVTSDTVGFVSGLKFLDTGALFNWEIKSPATGRFQTHWANVARDYFTYYDRNATVANGYARTIDATAPNGNNGSLGFAAQYYRGAHTVMKWRGMQAAAPTTTVQLQGDSFEFLTPIAGGFFGQVNTLAGTPGNWRNYGEIGGGGNAAVQAAGAKTNLVTANGRHLQITTNNGNIAAGAVALFVVNNTTVLADDIVLSQRKSGGTAGAYNIWTDSSAAGTFTIAIQNLTAGILGEVIVIQTKVQPSFIAA